MNRQQDAQCDQIPEGSDTRPSWMKPPAARMRARSPSSSCAHRSCAPEWRTLRAAVACTDGLPLLCTHGWFGWAERRMRIRGWAWMDQVRSGVLACSRCSGVSPAAKMWHGCAAVVALGRTGLWSMERGRATAPLLKTQRESPAFATHSCGHTQYCVSTRPERVRAWRTWRLSTSSEAVHAEIQQ